MNGDLASRQAALVAALVSGAPVPSGFDDRLVGVARRALLRKRADDVRRQWPMLAASFGPAWVSTFATWAETRESRGSLRDGWDLARSRAPLAAAAAAELREREALWAYDGASAPRRRGRVSAAVRMWWARR
ncbi:MAG TPA: hypothetical protein VI011_09975 [Asanoa sp.]